MFVGEVTVHQPLELWGNYKKKIFLYFIFASFHCHLINAFLDLGYLSFKISIIHLSVTVFKVVLARYINQFVNISRDVNSFVLHLTSVDVVSHIQGHN